MYVRKEALKYILDRHKIFVYITGFILINIFTMLNIWLITILLRNTLVDTLNTRLSIVKQAGYVQPMTYCNILNCDYYQVTIDGNLRIYKVEDGKVEETDKYIPAPKDFILKFFKDVVVLDRATDIKYYIDITDYGKVVKTISTYIFVICNLIWLVMSLLVTYLYYRSNSYRKRLDSMYMEDKLSSNITEMLHHELSAPVSVVSAISKNIKYWANDNIKNITNPKFINNAVNDLDLVVDRLLAIITQLSTNKHIKRTVDRKPILDLISNCFNTINSFNVKSIKLDYATKEAVEILAKHRAKDINNGDILNMLNILIVNSMEAMANSIIIDAKIILPTNNLILLITDNGGGIRDNYGNISKDPNIIFTYGYSTKGTSTKKANIVRDNWFYRLLAKVGLNVIDTDIDRGIGLAIVSTTLETYRGSISIAKTTEQGTTFCIEIPVEGLHTPIDS